jgi:hypothetical protein
MIGLFFLIKTNYKKRIRVCCFFISEADAIEPFFGVIYSLIGVILDERFTVYVNNDRV